MKHKREYHEESLSERFDRWMENYETTHGEKITQNEVAKKIGISSGALSKIISEDQVFKASDALGLSKVFGISCDEVITGNRSEHSNIIQFGLDSHSFEWLESAKVNHPEYNSVINTILSNKNLADLLCRILLLYSNFQMLKVSSIDSSDFIYINSDTNLNIANCISMSFMERFLSSFKQRWVERIDKKLGKQKLKFRKDASDELMKRLRFKQKARITQINTIKELNAIEDALYYFEQEKTLWDEIQSVEKDEGIVILPGNDEKD